MFSGDAFGKQHEDAAPLPRFGWRPQSGDGRSDTDLHLAGLLGISEVW